MCEIHLVETLREDRLDLAGECSYCEKTISGTGWVVQGTLDDGTPGVWQAQYHSDCLWEAEHDEEAIAAGDGCFSYGAVTRVG